MNRLIESIIKSIRMIVGLCLIEKSSKGDDGIQADVVLLGNERHSKIRVLQQYGFASVPVNGYEALALFVGGSRDNGVVVCCQGKAGEIPALAEGEVALFSRFGQKVILKNDGSIAMVPASGKKTRVESDLDVTGNVTAFCDANFITMQNHIHPTPVGPSSPPTPGN